MSYTWKTPFQRRLPALAALAFAGTLVLSACVTGESPQNSAGNGPEPPPPETTSSTEAMTEAASSEGSGSLGPVHVPAITPMGNPDTRVKSQSPEGAADLDVVNARTASHDGFDRVVFDTTGTGVPGWHIDYTETPVQQGSGFPIEFDGTVALSVMIRGVTGPADVPDVPGTGGSVTEILSDTTHHATTHFVIGMNEVLPYSVQVLQEPQRLVIDILHEGEGAPSPLGQPHVEDRSQESVAPHQRVVTNVRMATHDSFDRVVFDTAGEGGAGWFTNYTANPVQLGSGLPVAYEGNVALEIRLSGMVPRTAEGHEQADLDVIPGTGGVINEVVSGTTYHGQTQYVIGMNEVLPYSIQVIEEPHRVVVDILHG